MSFLAKQNGLLYLAVAISWMFMNAEDKQAHTRIIQIILLTAGCIVSSLLVLLPIAFSGAFNDFINQVVLFNSAVASVYVSVSSFVALLVLLLTSGPVLWIGAFAGLCELLPTHRANRVIIGLLLLFYLLFTVHLFNINDIIIHLYPRINSMVAGSRRLAVAGVIVSLVTV